MYELYTRIGERAETGVTLDQAWYIQDPHVPPMDSGTFELGSD